MFIPTNISIVSPRLLDEATVGRFEYGDITQASPEHRATRKSAEKSTFYDTLRAPHLAVLRIEGELLVDEEELKLYEDKFDIYTPDLPVDEPFQSWTDLIDAVKERTPEARKLLRYLEDFGYQDILKTKREVIAKVGDKDVKQIRWENFLLPSHVAQGAGFESGADYNRHMYQELLKHAPRTLAPDIYGGKKLQRGSSGSRRVMKKRVGPMVDAIIEDHRAEVLGDLKDVFGVLPDRWVNSILGPNEQNVQYGKDEKAIHLGRSIEVVPSNKDYLELSRLDRVLKLLLARERTDAEGYEAAVEKVKAQIKEKQEECTGKYEIIYIEMHVKMGDFISEMAEEFENAPVERSGDSAVCKTSLTNLPELISLLDPPTGRVRWVSRAGQQRPTTQFGFREDLYEVIGEAASTVFGPTTINMVERDGSINMEMEQMPEPDEPEEESDAEDYDIEEAINRIREEV